MYKYVKCINKQSLHVYLSYVETEHQSFIDVNNNLVNILSYVNNITCNLLLNLNKKKI